jgi:hypothetical protein
MAMTVWAVYDHPTDYPEGYEAREYEIRPGEYRSTRNVLQTPDLETLRRILREEMGKSVAHHFAKIDTTILEVWM